MAANAPCAQSRLTCPEPRALTLPSPDPLRIVLASVGSLGDVHPFIAIGQGLRSRGHAVTLLCNDEFAGEVTRAGLVHAPAGPAVRLDAAMASPNLWHPIKGLGVFWKHMLAPAIEPTFRRIEAIAADGPCAVVAPPVMFGARFACQALGLPLVSTYTAPAVLRTDAAPVTMAHWTLPRGTPRALVRLAWRALDRHKLHPMAARTLNEAAARLGARPPPATLSLFGEWMHSPDGGVTLFPEWFAPARPGWPSGLRFGSFPLYEGDAAASLPPTVNDFLAAGEAPVVFMPGSAMQHAQRFFEAGVEACGQLGLRALLLTPHCGQLPQRLPAFALHVDYLPFASLLPQARALVHHGGIGSCAQALRAGLPQLVTPMAHDQFDNAACLQRLGLGLSIRQENLSAATVANALRTLLARPSQPWDAGRAALRAPTLDPLARLIEDLATARPGRPPLPQGRSVLG